MSDEANADAVLAALDRLTAWSEMARSPQLTRFLDYIVRKRLAGDAQSIKAYSIAVDVFGRPTDFDPQSDPIVRVQARRLRALLDQYYRGPGADEILRIHLPVGRYVPDFVEVDVPAADLPGLVEQQAEPDRESAGGKGSPRGHVTVSWFVLLIIAIGAAALAYSLSTWSPRRDSLALVQGALSEPSLRVMEFQNLTGDSTLTAPISALAIELVTDFAPNQIVDVSFGGRQAAQTPASSNSYVLTGLVQRDRLQENEFQISAILTDVLSNGVLWTWSDTISRNDMTRRGGIEDISQNLLLLLGGTRGPLHDRARKVLESSIAGQENFYLCAVLFSEYRTTANAETANRVSSCFDAMPEADQQRGPILAARASLVAEAAGEPIGSTADQLDRFRRANGLIEEAVRLSPTNAFVWEQRARIQEELGMHELAEAAYGMSLQLNVSGIDSNAAHARHMALIGQLDEAVPIAETMIDVLRPALVPDWFYCVPALDALRQEDFSETLGFAERCAHADAELGPILALLAAQGLDDRAMVAQQLSRVLEVGSFRSGGIVTRMRRRITDEALLGKMRAGLAEAGVPALSLVSAY